MRHGIYVSDVPTSIVPPVQVSAGLPVVFGTAPINLSADGEGVTNKPVLCYTWADCESQLGYSADWENYTLCEAMYAFFNLFTVAPVVFVNVLDPEKHTAQVADKAVTLAAGKVTLPDQGIMPDTLVVKLTQAGQELRPGTDYTASFDDAGNLIVAQITGGAITSPTSNLVVSYTKLDPSKVTSADIIGGVDAATGAYTGLQLLDHVFPYFRLVPGQVLAPFWSTKPEVAAVMEAKAGAINGVFRSMTLVDIPTSAVKKYSDAPNWINQNNYVFPRQYVCWPKVSLGGQIFHMSTQAAALNCWLDSQNGDVPYQSPSNNNLQMDSLVLEDGTPVVFGLAEANYLNGQGIATALNWIGGWRLWGNRTACYPANTDPKDSFLSIRRMFDWDGNTFLLTFWQKVDRPANRRLIETIIDSDNIRLNGLASRGYILGGRKEFLASENPTTDLMNGIIRFHTYFTPPAPAEEIEEQLEYDTSYLSTLFGDNG